MSKRMKQIDDKTKQIVIGFVREAQEMFQYKENPYYNICDLIVRLCLIYYAMDEYWAEENISNSCIIAENGIKLKCIQKGWHNTSYGNLKVPSKGIYVYRWWFKIISPRTPFFCIGICDSTYNTKNESFAFAAELAGYYWRAWSGILKQLKPRKEYTTLPIMNGDTIIIELDTKQGKITFYKCNESLIEKESQDKLLNAGSIDIEQNEDLFYQICVTVNQEDACLILLDFKEIKI